MSEQKPNRNWELFKAKADNIRIRTTFALDDAIKEIQYRTVIPPEKHKVSSGLAEAFGGESLTFLKDNLTAKLNPLHPSKDQIRLFQHVIDSADSNDLLLKETRGRLYTGDRPMITKHYEALSRFENTGDPIDRIMDLQRSQESNLTVRWGVEDPFPHGFAVFGRVGMNFSVSLNFITFPEKPLTAEAAQQVLKIPEKQSGFTQHVALFNKGERIIIDREGVFEGDNVKMTDQYYLIGAFDGEGTNRTFWIYGSNRDEHDRMSVSPRVELKSLADQKAEM